MPELSPTQLAFKTLVVEQLWPWLSERGFRKRAQNFHRRVGENWEVVSVQRSTFSDRDDIRFTVDLGVAYGPLRTSLQTWWREGRRPLTYQAHLNQRIGMLMTGEDHWWALNPAVSPFGVGAEVVAALAEAGLPWLEARSSVERLADLLDRPAGRKLQSSDSLWWMARVLEGAGEDLLADAVAQEGDRQNAATELWRMEPDDADRAPYPGGLL